MQKTKIYSVISLLLFICVLFSSCSLVDNKKDFNINITRMMKELKDYSYGQASNIETVISIYGIVTANVNCNRIKISCDVYSKYNQKVCSPIGLFNIQNGQSIEFNIFARPQNSGHLDTPLHTANIKVSIVR